MDPVSAISLAALAGDLIKAIYAVYGVYRGAPEQVKELCMELFALQDALSRVSAAMQFPLEANSHDILLRFATPEFEKMMTSTQELLKDLVQRVAPPAKGIFQSGRQRIMWVLNKSSIAECLRTIERRKEYFSMVLSSSNLGYIQKVFSEVTSLSEQNIIELHQSLASWLGAPDYYSQHAAYLTSRHPGTGSWFVDGPLASWLRGGSPAKILWLRGISGGGKSIIASHSIEWATIKCDKKPTLPTILYFHCNFQNVSTQTLSGVMASFVHQMCERQPGLWSRVKAMSYKPVSGTRDSRQGASADQLQRLFKELSPCFPKLCIFIDALNESSNPPEIIAALGDAINCHPSMQLCIFSTHDPLLQSVIKLSLPYKCVEINTDMQRQDFECYIKGSIEKDLSLRAVSEDLKSSIVQELSLKANCSFLWVDRQLKNLADQDNAADARRALRSLPPSLDTDYRGVLMIIAQKDRVRVRRLLRWLAVQTRPLTTMELSEAVIVNVGTDSTTLNREEKIWQNKIEYYLKLVGSLVQYDMEKNTVKLVHPSVQEFLLSPKRRHDKDIQDLADGDHVKAMDMVLQACLWYLSQAPFSKNPSYKGNRLQLRWPLFDYCAKSWPIFAEKLLSAGTDVLGYTKNEIRRLFDSSKLPNGGSYGFWLRKIAPNYVPLAGQSWPMLPPLHLAAGRGWLSLVKLILAGDKKDFDVPSGESHLTPLMRAATYNHEDVVHYLLDAGANPAPEDDAEWFEMILSSTSPRIRQLINAARSTRMAMEPALAVKNAAAGNMPKPATPRSKVIENIPKPATPRSKAVGNTLEPTSSRSKVAENIPKPASPRSKAVGNTPKPTSPRSKAVGNIPKPTSSLALN